MHPKYLDKHLVKYLEYKDTGFYSDLMLDYLEGKSDLKQFIEYENSLDGFAKIISERNSKPIDRALLLERVNVQNSENNLSELSSINIKLLGNENTFTVTTGHQLSFFTGPLYFIYKTLSVIKLAEELKMKFPDNNFVPVFWMATEDHDFDEINHFRFKEKNFDFKTDQKGAVGKINLETLKDVFNLFAKEIGGGKRTNYLKNLFKNTYLKHSTLTEATRFLVNELFGKYGVVIVDGDDADLKRKMIPVFEKELLSKSTNENLNLTNSNLKKLGYKVQVNQREINLFYLKDNLRERIVLDSGRYRVLNTELEFSEIEIINELNLHPERFSPNAILRPLYQEAILPNIAYVGGGGELAYWLQLKRNFKYFNVSFPILALRNSVMLINEKQNRILNKLSISNKSIFYKTDFLISIEVEKNSKTNLSLEKEKKEISILFNKISIANKQLEDSVIAHKVKQLKSLEQLENKIFKSEKRKQKDLVNAIIRLKSELFPNEGLQERKSNFSEMYLEFGENLIEDVYNNISMLDNKFTTLSYLK